MENNTEQGNKLFDEMGEFVVNTFPNANAVHHLRKLVKEAQEAIESPADISEYADCLLCVFGAAKKASISYHQLIEASFIKLGICLKREWTELPDGTFQHKLNVVQNSETSVATED